jgi:hypothetical protein
MHRNIPRIYLLRWIWIEIQIISFNGYEFFGFLIQINYI